MCHQPGPMIIHSAQTAPRTAVTTVVFSTELKAKKKKKKKRQQTEQFPCVQPKGWTGEIQSTSFFFFFFFLFLPVRNLLEANKDAEGRRSEIFQVSLGG